MSNIFVLNGQSLKARNPGRVRKAEFSGLRGFSTDGTCLILVGMSSEYRSWISSEAKISIRKNIEYLELNSFIP